MLVVAAMTMSPETTTALDLEGGSSEEMAEEVTASSVLLDGSTGLVEVSTSEADQTSSTSPSFRHHSSLLDIGFQSPLPSVERGGGGGSKSASEMPEISVGYSPQLSAVGGDDDFPPELADFSVGLSGGMVAGVSHIKSAEKTRRFPVPLSEGDVVGTICMLPTAVSQENNGVKESLSFEADSLKAEKHAGEHESDGHVRGSPSDSEGEEDCEQASSSEAAHLSSAAIVRTNLSASDEPLQDILESKIAELEVACTGPSKVDEEEAKIGTWMSYDCSLVFSVTSSGPKLSLERWRVHAVLGQVFRQVRGQAHRKSVHLGRQLIYCWQKLLKQETLYLQPQGLRIGFSFNLLQWNWHSSDRTMNIMWSLQQVEVSSFQGPNPLVLHFVSGCPIPHKFQL